ncbi:MAG: CCA tRNA nucleotidyltransferase, partial [Cyanobacteria bacterium]|nr:CCA tRNA nucleotidyltransferase [Cyanobacteriota bacterium]
VALPIYFYGHEKISKKFVRKILTALHYKKSFIEEVSNLVDWHMDLHGYGREGEIWKDNTIRRLLNKMKDLYPKFIGLVKADITSARPQKVKAGIMRVEDFESRANKIIEEEKIEKIKPLIDGNEIMQILNIQPSPLVGEIKNYIFQKQLDLGPNYTKEEAFIDLRKKYKELQKDN